DARGVAAAPVQLVQNRSARRRRRGDFFGFQQRNQEPALILILFVESKQRALVASQFESRQTGLEIFRRLIPIDLPAESHLPGVWRVSFRHTRDLGKVRSLQNELMAPSG